VAGCLRCNVRVDGFALPGYEIDELLGFGGSGEVWRARECASGDTVALKRVRAVAGSSQQLYREAALLASVQHEHVVRLRSVATAPDGLVLVLDYAAGGSLAAVLGGGRPLSAGEVVTIGAPLAQALADVHARGLIHGDVTPANIVFDAAGKPMLADLGVARLIGEPVTTVGLTAGYADPAVVAGSLPTPASDIFGLAAVCYSALTAGARPGVASGAGAGASFGDCLPSLVRVPAAMIAAIEAALDPDPHARPDAASFARALYASCAPEPVRLAGRIANAPVSSAPTHRAVLAAPARAPLGSLPGTTATEPGRHRLRRRTVPAATLSRALPLRRGFSKRLLLSLVAMVLVAGAVGVGISWAAHDRSAAASAVQASPAAPGSAAPSPGLAASSAPPIMGDPVWAKVLSALDGTRDQAFADADLDELGSVYVATSSALAADRDTLGELIDAGEHARGLNLELTSVVVRSRTPTTVVLDVHDVLPGYDLVRADGSIDHQPGRADRAWVVTLRTQVAGGSWRIDSITTG
jgi:eukaryotic-like serine/threonine-protein kinase